MQGVQPHTTGKDRAESDQRGRSKHAPSVELRELPRVEHHPRFSTTRHLLLRSQPRLVTPRSSREWTARLGTLPPPRRARTNNPPAPSAAARNARLDRRRVRRERVALAAAARAVVEAKRVAQVVAALRARGARRVVELGLEARSARGSRRGDSRRERSEAIRTRPSVDVSHLATAPTATRSWLLIRGGNPYRTAR